MKRPSLFIIPFVMLGCASRPTGTPQEARAAFVSGQSAELHKDLNGALRFFTLSRDLAAHSGDWDKAAWAQWEISECLAVQPTRRADALNALHRLICDYRGHFLSGRAQVEIDRLTGKKPAVVAQAPLDTSCGPEMLFYLLTHSFHRATSLEALKKTAGTGEHGTTLLGLKNAAEMAGLHAEGIKVDLAYLRHLDKPAIAWVRRSHYLGVLATPATLIPPFFAVKVWDPTTNKETVMAPEDFARQWDGYLLILSGPVRVAERGTG